MQFFIFHQTLLNPHSETNSIFGLLDRVIPGNFSEKKNRKRLRHTGTNDEILSRISSDSNPELHKFPGGFTDWRLDFECDF
jgi:hypothetical protein